MKYINEIEANIIAKKYSNYVNGTRMYGTVKNGIYEGQIIALMPKHKKLKEFEGNLKDIYITSDNESFKKMITSK